MRMDALRILLFFAGVVSLLVIAPGRCGAGWAPGGPCPTGGAPVPFYAPEYVAAPAPAYIPPRLSQPRQATVRGQKPEDKLTLTSGSLKIPSPEELGVGLRAAETRSHPAPLPVPSPDELGIRVGRSR